MAIIPVSQLPASSERANKPSGFIPISELPQDEELTPLSSVQSQSKSGPSEGIRVLNQALSGLALDIPNIGNKPMSEVLAGPVGANIEKGAGSLEVLPKILQMALNGGPIAANTVPTAPLIEGTLNSRYGFPAPALPESSGGQLIGTLLNAAGQAITMGGIEKATATPQITSAPKVEGLSASEIKTAIEHEQNFLQNKMNAVESNKKVMETRNEVLNTHIEKTARDEALKYRNPENYYPAFRNKYEAFGRGLKFATEGVDIPKDDIRSILLEAGQKQGIFDADGNLTRQTKGPEKGFVEIARKYGALGSKQGSIPDEFVQAVKGGENLDPAMQKVILDAYKRDPRSVTARGFGYAKGEYNKTVNLNNLMDEVAGVKNSVSKGAPSKYDRISTNLNSALIDYLEENGSRVGMTPEKQAVLSKIKAEYKPFAEFKNAFYDYIDPHNEKGSIGKSQGHQLFAQLAKGELDQYGQEFFNRFRQYIDPKFDFSIQMKQNALSGIKNKMSHLEMMKNSLEMQRKSLPEVGEMAEALKKAQTVEEALKGKMSIAKMKDYIKKFGLKYAARKAFIYQPFNMLQKLVK